MTCPNRLHGDPLPGPFLAASAEADARLEAGWDNRECPDCHEYGWEPPVVRDIR